MPGRNLRWLSVGMLSAGGAALLALTSAMNASLAYGAPAPTPPGEPPFPNPDVSYVELMGGSGTPIPQEGMGGAYMGDVFDRFLAPNFPDVSFASPCPSFPCEVNGLFTPEGLYPLTGVKDLTVNESVARGETILNTQILNDLADPTKVPAGDALGVFGYSQSADIASLVMPQLLAEGVSPDQVNFVLIGDQMNPNGGILERFDGFINSSGQTFDSPQLALPSLGYTFYGATPANDFPTTVYTLEYDGYADFPKYPINFLSDLNAFLGLGFGNPSVHGSYPILTDAQLASAVELPTTGATDTTYYMIPEQLPLLTVMGDLGVPKAVLDLIGPDLKVLVDLGYGGNQLDPTDLLQGGFANVATPFALFPNVDPTTLWNELVTGAQSGLAAFEADLATPAAWQSAATTSFADLFSAAVPAATPSLTDIANALSSALSDAYSVFLPLSDIANALSTSLPAYDATLFLDNIQNGDLLDALGLPIAANTALDTLAAGFAYEVIQGAISNITADLAAIGL
jgi:hypothetical protein